VEIDQLNYKKNFANKNSMKKQNKKIKRNLLKLLLNILISVKLNEIGVVLNAEENFSRIHP
jgi:hypothetical protein